MDFVFVSLQKKSNDASQIDAKWIQHRYKIQPKSMTNRSKIALGRLPGRSRRRPGGLKEPWKQFSTILAENLEKFHFSGPILGGKIGGKCAQIDEKIDIFWARTSKRNFHRFLEDFGGHVGWILDGFWEACCERLK